MCYSKIIIPFHDVWQQPVEGTRHKKYIDTSVRFKQSVEQVRYYKFNLKEDKFFKSLNVYNNV